MVPLATVNIIRCDQLIRGDCFASLIISARVCWKIKDMQIRSPAQQQRLRRRRQPKTDQVRTTVAAADVYDGGCNPLIHISYLFMPLKRSSLPASGAAVP